MSRRHTLALIGVLLCAAVSPTLARADFGLVPGSATATAVNRDGTLDTQAGSHPYAFSVHFALNTDAEGRTEGGVLRDVLTDLPPGLFGNPSALPACPRESFEGVFPNCAPGTQVGVMHVVIPELSGELSGPLYNLEPEPGSAATLGFAASDFVALLSASVSPDKGYAVHLDSNSLPLEASEITATIWGTPADPSHDPERGFEGGESTDTPQLPFLTLPTSCESPPQVTLEFDSRFAPGTFVGGDEPAIFRDGGGNPLSLTRCDSVPFQPEVLAAPTTTAADSAAGLDFQLKLPNKGLWNPREGAITETEPVKTEVTLPAGITANPAAVSGLGVCTPQQFKAADTTSGPGQGCPESSKVGSLLAQTPLLDEAIEGSVYLAAPHDNPFNSLLALYIIARAPARGVLVKQAGLVTPDPATGQLSTVFDGLPPVPYSSFEVRLRGGARAPLITPQLCGTYTTSVRLYSFAEPGQAVVRSAPFTIATGAGGGGCAASEAQLPNNPTLTAGTTAPVAGAYAPFVFNLARADGEQRFASLQASLPEGLVGRLAGVPYCPEAAIAAAAARSGEGQGALEQALPSCPGASRVGGVIAGAGAGPVPYQVPGAVYLAGPYKGAPLSIAIITPAIAGPFDLGTVVVRAGLYVDESTAKVTVRSDPLPRILHGLPLDIRSISVRMDRPGFILNPTSCAEKSISAGLISQSGQIAALANRFQVGGCRGLDFAPKLQLSLKGATKRDGHPALKAVLKQDPEQANIARTAVALPPTEFIDPDHLNNPCTRPQFNAGVCPATSLLGKARAYTPLLDEPLEGPVYFRANGGERDLPDVVADLNGQVHLILVGFVDSIHKKGSEASRLRTTFATVPDAPVSRFVLELKGGKKNGLLVNSANICKSANRAIVRMRGQNGKASNSKPRIATSCGKKRKSKK